MTTSLTPNSPVEMIGFDPNDPELRRNPYPHYARLRERAPIFRSPLGFWILTAYRECLAVLQDDRFGYPRGADMHVGEQVVAGYSQQEDFLIFMNPPEHTRMREHVRTVLNHKTIQGLVPYVQSAVDRLLDDMAAEGPEVDLMSSYAQLLPLGVISELLGVPAADRAHAMLLAKQYLAGTGPTFLITPEQDAARDAALVQLRGYFAALVESRRDDPRDDLVSQLVGVHGTGGMTDGELLSTCVLMFVAGHSKATNVIGNSTLALLQHPDQRAEFVTEPEIVSNALEELVRYDTPTHQSFRVALTDVPLGEYLIRAGDRVLVMRGAANRDPAVFPNPDSLVLDRQDNRHIGFGAGRHMCIGSGLARLQGQIALSSLLNRFPRLQLASDDLEWHDSLLVRGLRRLPVLLDG